MGWKGERLVLVFLCFSPLIAPTFASDSANFADCFPGDPLARFWQDPHYISANPNIITI